MPWDVESRSQRWKRLHPEPLNEHGQKAYRRRRMDDPRLAAAQRLRSSQRWQDFRAWFLRRNPLCAECRRKGRTNGATQVDHVRALRWFPVEGMEAACYDEGNVQALCSTCHGQKSAREQAEDRRRGRPEERSTMRARPPTGPVEHPTPEPEALKVKLEVLGVTQEGLLQTLRLEPGDVLALTVPTRLPASSVSHLRACMRELVPDGVKVAILEEGMGLVKVRPPEPGAPAPR